MQNHSLNVLGQVLSFKAEVDPDRLKEARQMLENRFAILKRHGRTIISKEKLLTFLALALADDLLQSQEELREAEKKVWKIMTQIDSNMM
ncbi:MAG: cell division protein ZapA [Deltaproteobacteria bacterium]|jgi:cell division protein ZapA|nr:cell division protein ZapA [Deltaproteobacteria bacterium]